MNKRDFETKTLKAKRKKRFEKTKRAEDRKNIPKSTRQPKHYVKGGDDWLPEDAQNDPPNGLQFKE